MDIKFTRHQESEIHTVFDVTLLLKGLHAAAELLGGLLLYAVGPGGVVRVARYFLGDELQEQPRDAVANYFLRLAESLGGTAHAFAVLYLLIHGVINMAIVIALWKEKLWAYPASLAALMAFVVYQCYLLSFGFSFWMFAFTVLDIAIVLLVWHEYGVLKRRRKAAHARNAAHGA